MKQMRETRKPAEEAARLFREAERLERKRPIDFSEAALNPLYAEQAREQGQALLVTPARLAGDARTELVSAADATSTTFRQYLANTLAEPNMISVDASEHRARLATEAGVLSPAIDAAVTAHADNSIEKMLCHQLAAAHSTAMGLLIRLENSSVVLPPGEVARLTNAAARLFEVFQNGTLALQKLKTGGTQRVVVQYQQQVNVGSGGQAVVASKVKRGPRNGGRRRNGQ